MMALPVDGETRRGFLVHLLIALATLGLYMPVWLAWRDQEVCERIPGDTGVPSAWALGAATALALIARPVFGESSPGLALGLSLLAVVVFLVGLYQVTTHLARALARLEFETPAPPLLVTALVALVFVGIEAGNGIDSLVLRVPVLLLILTLPYVFWRLHIGFETVMIANPIEAPATDAPTTS